MSRAANPAATATARAAGLVPHAEAATRPGPQARGGAVVIKRAREPASADDGTRVLVDRLWPRGLSKQQVAADLWLREVAPSDALRHWFGHVPERFAAFSERYRGELASHDDLLHLLDDLAQRGRLTLLYNAGDSERNNACVLRQVLIERATEAN